MNKDYLTPPVAVALLGGVITTGTLANWRATGTGPPFIRIGGRILYRRVDLDRWAAAHLVETTNVGGDAA
ncbi:helix-turn-helix transcriptional regulator [Brevibacterium sp. FAM 24638]|uniref:helix-turn-helix transcriptional regulator n=1 Tax=Brevibacterium sp. FAM 24638 TaxID=3415681 RepID=UPI003C7CD3E3